MMAFWHSLYLPCADPISVSSVSQALLETLVTLGYTLYNPFGLLPGKAYPRTARLFVAPESGGWIRIISAADTDLTELLPALSGLGLCLYTVLDGETAVIRACVHRAEMPLESALAAYVRTSAEDLTRVLYSADLRIVPKPAQTAASPFDALPEDVQALAGQVDRKQAEKMFARLSKNLMGKAGGDAEAANRLIAGEGAPDWNSPGGRRIAALMDCLTRPAQWREPDFTELRDAYQLHERRRRNLKATLYPGDSEAMAKVANALDYTPVYGGRS
jgi:hypothetical protein